MSSFTYKWLKYYIKLHKISNVENIVEWIKYHSNPYVISLGVCDLIGD